MRIREKAEIPKWWIRIHILSHQLQSPCSCLLFHVTRERRSMWEGYWLHSSSGQSLLYVLKMNKTQRLTSKPSKSGGRARQTSVRAELSSLLIPHPSSYPFHLPAPLLLSQNKTKHSSSSCWFFFFSVYLPFLWIPFLTPTHFLPPKARGRTPLKGPFIPLTK